MSGRTAVGVAVEIAVESSLDGVSDAEWDDLIEHAGGFYSSRRWLRSVQAEPGCECRYLFARIGERLVGGLPVYGTSAGPAAAAHYRIADRWPSGTGAPYLLLGSASGYHTSLILARDLEDDLASRVLTALLDRAAKLGTEVGAAGLAMLFVDPDSARRLAHLLGSQAQPSLSLAADSFIELTEPSVAAFTASLHPTARKNARYEWRPDRRPFPVSSVAGPAGARPEEVGRFVAMVEAHYGKPGGERQYAATFARQLAELGDQLVTFRMGEGEQTCGLYVAFRWRDTLFLRMGGFDPAYTDRVRFGYFTLAVYDPITFALEQGLAAVRLGVGSEQAKVGRGACLEPLVDFGWDLTPAALAATDSEAVGYWRDRRARLAHGFRSPDWQFLDAIGAEVGR